MQSCRKCKAFNIKYGMYVLSGGPCPYLSLVCILSDDQIVPRVCMKRKVTEISHSVVEAS